MNEFEFLVLGCGVHRSVDYGATRESGVRYHSTFCATEAELSPGSGAGGEATRDGPK
jgi:hypothetical protein